MMDNFSLPVMRLWISTKSHYSVVKSHLDLEPLVLPVVSWCERSNQSPVLTGQVFLVGAPSCVFTVLTESGWHSPPTVHIYIKHPVRGQAIFKHLELYSERLLPSACVLGASN
ncbi:hypothetical protein RRG08_012423 [Elysia crispata]|uniref:Uncharacterized protein n=1 Tax=Elysia crispata TaxID=231223 RepID=A0AAE1DXB3_9GAST|nr:hypothetical protein RRG08_012423 [Elysia crispata]